MLDNIEVLCHSSIRMVKDGKVIYFDPFKIDSKRNDADYIFITHGHYDHFSKEDIIKVKKDTSIIILTTDLINDAKILGFSDKNILAVLPNNSYDKRNKV